MMTPFAQVLEKFRNDDKDLRFMAVTDATKALRDASLKFDADTEAKVTSDSILLLRDQASMVLELLPKFFEALIPKLTVDKKMEILEEFCKNLTAGDGDLCDISAMSLKASMAALSKTTREPNSNNCIKHVLDAIVNLLNEQTSRDLPVQVKVTILTVMADSMPHYAPTAQGDLMKICQMLFLYVNQSGSVAIHSIKAIGILAKVADSDLYGEIVNKLLIGLQSQSPSTVSAFGKACSEITRVTSARFVEFIPQFIPKLVSLTTSDEESILSASLQLFEAFISHCPSASLAFTGDIKEICIKLMEFSGNTDDDEMEVDCCDEDSDISSDNDDDSWKVRMYALKCVIAIIQNYSNLLHANCEEFGPLLLRRFREREENVRMYVYQAYTALLKKAFSLLSERSENDAIESNYFDKLQKSIAETLSDEARISFKALKDQSASVMETMQTLLRKQNQKDSHNCLQLLSYYIRVVPDSCSSIYGTLIGSCRSTVDNPQIEANVKADAVNLTGLLLITHSAQTISVHLKDLVPFILRAVEDPIYKIALAGLYAARCLICALSTVTELSEFNPLLANVSEVIIAKLQITNMDLEVKEKSIEVAAVLMSKFGDKTEIKSNEILGALVSHLQNEMIACTAMKALNAIIPVCTCAPCANGTGEIVDTLHLTDSFNTLVTYVRKNQRQLVISSLSLLNTLLSNFKNGEMESVEFGELLTQLPTLMLSHDAQIALLAISHAKKIVAGYPQQAQSSISSLIDTSVSLAKNPMLHHSALDVLLQLFEAIVKSALPKVPKFEAFVSLLSSAATETADTVSLQVYVTLAKCIATSALAFGAATKVTQLLSKLNSSIKSEKEDTRKRILNILVLGEIYRAKPPLRISPRASINPELLILHLFEAQSEELKSAASHALGSLALGQPQKYLAVILDSISNKSHKHLYLRALKEIIDNANELKEAQRDAFNSEVKRIWDSLLQRIKSGEEGASNDSAECLGKLIIWDPKQFLTDLQESMSDGDGTRKHALLALRTYIVSKSTVVNDVLKHSFAKFMEACRDEDLEVRRSAIMTLNAALHNKIDLVRNLLNSLTPVLYNETRVKPELIREIEMGPFKHIIDDGLDLRKSAFECMLTLGERCLEVLDSNEYMKNLQTGMDDHRDVKVLVFLTLIKLSQSHPVIIASHMDELCEHIKTTLTAGVKTKKEVSGGQESDKLEELKTLALRVILNFKKIATADRNAGFKELTEIIAKDPQLSNTLTSFESSGEW